jgi:hypothetical protein
VAGSPIDASGYPLRAVPRRAKKDSSDNSFDSEEFRQTLQRHGERLQWEQASRCPCSADAQFASPDPICGVCGGSGWEYFNPIEVRAIVDRLEFNVDILEALGDWAFGSASITLEGVHRPNNCDRFVVTENVISYTEGMQRGIVGSDDRPTFPVAHITDQLRTSNGLGQTVLKNVSIGVIRLRTMTADRKPGRVLQAGVDFDVTAAGHINWHKGDQRGTAPAAATSATARNGGRYAMLYYHHPSYLVVTFPYSMRTHHTESKAPLRSHDAGPVSCMAKLEHRRDVVAQANYDEADAPPADPP